MQCPGCSEENPEGRQFCAKCGDELQPQETSAAEEVSEQLPLSLADLEKKLYFSKQHVPIIVTVAGATHVGNNPRKPNNEDRWKVIRRSYPVQKLEVVVVFIFDGMGSYPGGEKGAAIGLAEAAACVEFQLPMYDAQYRWETDENGKAIWHEAIPKWEFTSLLLESLSQDNLTSAMQSANTRIIKGGLAAGLTFGKFGSTVVAGYIITDLETGRVVKNGFNAGDARISMSKGDCFTQLSKDHVIMAGVSRFLGAKTSTTDPGDYNKPLKHVVMGHKFSITLWMAEEDANEVWIVYYSDGMGNMLSPETISARLSGEPQAVCDQLIDNALTIDIPYAKTLGSDKAFAGDDNITVILVKISKTKVAQPEVQREKETPDVQPATDPQRPAQFGGDSDVHESGGSARPEDEVLPQDNGTARSDGRDDVGTEAGDVHP